MGNARGDTLTLRAGETLGAFDIVYVSNRTAIGRNPIDIVEASVRLNGPAEGSTRLRFPVDWSGADNAGDRVVLVDGDGGEHDYAYIDPNESSVELVAPAAAGNYTLVYRSRGGNEMARWDLVIVPVAVSSGELQVTQRKTQLGPNDAVEIKLDASGSMLQRLDGERRIEIARRTLTDLVTTTRPPGAGFALRVFGHREADSCRTDLEIPLAPLDPTTTVTIISGINAMNLARTPIGASIAAARGDLADVSGQRVLIVLTDGEETCEGDAASAIEALRSSGWDFRVNVVGFAIDDAELARLFESWAATSMDIPVTVVSNQTVTAQLP
ncbi:MAG: VWA domain-containing protein [Gammaproteobacteria bacterium]